MPPFKDNTIYLCEHCGNKTSGKYCPSCKTAAGRKEIDEQNIAIMKENLAKGFTYNNPHWNRLKAIAKI